MEASEGPKGEHLVTIVLSYLRDNARYDYDEQVDEMGGRLDEVDLPSPTLILWTTLARPESVEAKKKIEVTSENYNLDDFGVYLRTYSAVYQINTDFSSISSTGNLPKNRPILG